MTDIDVVILAGGKGTRLKDGLAKPMHKVAGLTMLEHIVSASRQIDPKQVIIVQADGMDYSAYGDSVVTQKEANGSAAALQTALPKVTSEKILVLNADMPLITGELLNEVVEHDQALVVAELQNPFGYGRVVVEKNKVASIVEEKDATQAQKKIKAINSGIYLFDTKKVTEDLKNISNDNAQGEYYLTDAANGLDVVIAENIEEIYGVNDHSQLAIANKIMRNRINQIHMKNGVGMIDPQTTYIDVNVSIEAGTVIEPNTVIQGPSTIGAFNTIGPNAHLRSLTKTENNVHIGNFVETKNAQIGAHTQIGHLSYIGDAVIGKSVNIGAGTIFVNYDGKNKHISTIGNHAFIGSNTKIVSPVTIEDEAITAAGSVITNDVKKHQLGIARARQENKDDFWDRMDHQE